MSIRRAVAREYMILKVLLFAIPASLVKRFNANQTSIDRTFRVNYVFIHFHSMTPKLGTVLRLRLFPQSSADLTIVVCLVAAGQELRGGAWM